MSIFSLLVSIFSLQFFFFTVFMVEGPSMEPTLNGGDVFLIDYAGAADSDYVRGDIIVFSLEGDSDYFYVKRVVGLPGERIQVRYDGIYIGESGAEVKLEEPYLPEGESSVLRIGSYKDKFRQTYNVPEDKYFVLGDNRAHSRDSRSFRSPFVLKSNIKGEYLKGLFGRDDLWFAALPKLVISTETGDRTVAVEVAEDDAERRQGLMFREKLPENRGMFFIYGGEAEVAFWMKNTLIPLDMVFFDGQFKVVNIVSNAVPCEQDPCETYPSVFPAQYVLEIGGGQSEVLGIKVGDTAYLIR